MTTMRKIVAQPLQDARRTLATGLAFFALLLAPAYLPSSLFMTVEDLRLISQGARIPGSQDTSDMDNVLQAQSPRWTMRLEWTAVVYEIFATGPDSERRELQLISHCHGYGVRTYQPLDRPAITPLEQWVGDPGCHLHDGTFQLYAQWTYRFLIWSWTVDARSALFTIKGRG